jgi:hypothetical protein
LATASPAAAWTATFAAAVAAGVVAVAAAEAVARVAAAAAAAASELILTCAGDAADADAACELAAMAAAAIASGAVAAPDPDAGVAAGAAVVGTATASATATGLGVVMDSGCATTAFEESAPEVLPEAGLSVDFAVPDFAVLDFGWDCWVALALALVLAPALASEGCPVAAPPPAELLLAVWSEPELLFEAVLSLDGELLSDRGWEDCCGVGAAGPLLLAALALLSTSAPKLSVAGDWSDRADFGGAV